MEEGVDRWKVGERDGEGMREGGRALLLRRAWPSVHILIDPNSPSLTWLHFLTVYKSVSHYPADRT